MQWHKDHIILWASGWLFPYFFFFSIDISNFCADFRISFSDFSGALGRLTFMACFHLPVFVIPVLPSTLELYIHTVKSGRENTQWQPTYKPFGFQTNVKWYFWDKSKIKLRGSDPPVSSNEEILALAVEVTRMMWWINYKVELLCHFELLIIAYFVAPLILCQWIKAISHVCTLASFPDFSDIGSGNISRSATLCKMVHMRFLL